MSIRFRVGACRSWLDSKHSRRLAFDLERRLTKRLRGESAVMLTLTYDRRDYENARELYRAAATERHVRRFIARLSSAIGENLSGRWICKMEFQAGGWVHWHLIITGLSYISHEKLSRTWGAGHVWINRLSPKRVRYFAKYVAKGAELPEWLYLERCRSVKIIRASPEFWRQEPEPRTKPKDNVRPLHGAYMTIGQCMERACAKVIAKDSSGRFSSFNADPFSLTMSLRRSGHTVTSSTDERGWLICHDVTMEQMERAAGAQRREAAGPRGLHLTRLRNPPTAEPPEPPLWLQRVWKALSDTQYEYEASADLVSATLR